MIKFLIHRPIAVYVTFIAICAIGLIVSRLLPVSLLPSISIPEITVQVGQDNLGALDIENGIVSQFRQQLQQIPGLNEIESESRDNFSIIRLKFDYGTNIDHAFIEVNDKIDASLAKMPKEVRRPRIIKASATDLPAFYLNLTLKRAINPDVDGSRFMQLCDFAENTIQKRIEQLPQVAMVDVTGIIKTQIFLLLDEQKMQSHGVTPETIGNAIKESHINAGNIQVREGLLQFSLNISSILQSPDEINKIAFQVNNVLYHIKDFAQLSVRPEPIRGLYLSDGKPSICMAVLKSNQSQQSELKEAIGTVIRQFEKDFPDVRFTISQDQSFLLEYSINNLKQNLLQGCILAIIIMFFFLKDYKSPLLISISLPIVLVISLLFFYLFHISINVVSLSGLILGIGMMIDNSIIVIDNILQYREKGYSLVDSIVNGTKEVIKPMIAATLTSCAVFVPLIFLSGIAGALFFDQAMAVAIGQGVSLLVSITLVPTAFFILNKKPISKKESRVMNILGFINIEPTYVKTYNVIYRYRYLSFIFLLGLLVFGSVSAVKLDKKLLPALDENETLLKVDWNENVTVEENVRRIQDILRKTKSIILQSNSFIGEQQFLLNRDLNLSPNESEIYIKVASNKQLVELKRILGTIIKETNRNVVFSFNSPGNPLSKLFSGKEANLVVHLQDQKKGMPPELEESQKVLKRIQSEIDGKSVQEIPLKKQLFIEFDQEKAALYGVPFESALNDLKNVFSSNIITGLSSSSFNMAIVSGIKHKSLEKVLESTFFTSNNGGKIPACELIKIKGADYYRSVYGGRAGIYVPINIGVPFSQTSEVTGKIRTIIQDYPDLKVTFSGSFLTNKKLLNEMMFIMIITLFLLYFILAAQFESLVIPLIVLIEIPVDIAFALIVLFICHNSINIMSLIGLVVMGGIIINDSILKIDTINQLRWSGMALDEAIQEGGRRRIKPILMTMLTSTIALVPQMFGHDAGAQLQFPMSLVIIAGMTLGTAVSLYMIPIFYRYMVLSGDWIRSKF